MKYLTHYLVAFLVLLKTLEGYNQNNTTSEFIFTSHKGDTTSIFISTLDGTQQYRITYGSKKELNATISPDKSKLLITLYSIEKQAFDPHYDNEVKWITNYTIYVYDFNTNQLTAVPMDSKNQIGWDWTPDSNWIICTDGFNGNERVVQVKIDGSEKKYLDVKSKYSSNLMVSPDGTKLVYQSLHTENKKSLCDLFSYDFETQEVVKLTNSDPTTRFWKPIWSPDGNYISYIRNDSCGSSVYVMKGNGTSSVKMFEKGFCGEFFSEGVSWSPDSKNVVFETTKGIYVNSVNGDKLNQIRSSGSQPKWCPSGNEMLFVENKNIFLIQLNQSKGNNVNQITFTEEQANLFGLHTIFR